MKKAKFENRHLHLQMHFLLGIWNKLTGVKGNELRSYTDLSEEDAVCIQ